jgi:hypothetical protein
MDVLEEQDERLNVRDRLHHLAGGPGDLLRAPLALERLHHPRGKADDVRDRILRAALAELLEGFLERVVVGDPRGCLDHLCERPVGDAFAVREGAADQDARPLDAVHEFAGEPALADPGLAVDREDVGAAVANRARERVLEELELRRAADERRAGAQRAPRAVECVHHAPGAKLAVQSLELERTGVLDDQAPGSEAVGGRPDEDLAGSCDLLETRRQVHGLAGREG